jgi:hypothetical protein
MKHEAAEFASAAFLLGKSYQKGRKAHVLIAILIVEGGKNFLTRRKDCA